MFNRFKTKPTLFLIGGTVAILCLIPAIIYYIPQNGGGAMYALMYMMCAGFAGFAIVIDVLMVKFINFKKVSLIEAGIALAVFLILSFQSRMTTIDFSQIKKPYLILVYDSKGINSADFKHAGIFDKIYTLKDTDVIHIDTASVNNYYQLNFNFPENWGVESISSLHKPEYIIECDFISSADLVKYSDTQRDSVVQRRLLIANVHNKNFRGIKQKRPQFLKPFILYASQLFLIRPSTLPRRLQFR